MSKTNGTAIAAALALAMVSDALTVANAKTAIQKITVSGTVLGDREFPVDR